MIRPIFPKLSPQNCAPSHQVRSQRHGVRASSGDSVSIRFAGNATKPTPWDDQHELTEQFLYAAKEGYVDSIKHFLQGPIAQGRLDINAKDADDSTAVIFAALTGQTEVLQLLLDAGADPNVKNKFEKTALLTALDTLNYEKTLQLLLRKAANPNIPNKKGETPLHAVALSGNVPLIQAFLKAGANPNLQDIYGMTPLHRALFSRKVELIPMFKQAGADLNLQNNRGKKTALHMALDYNDAKMVQALLTAGADFKVLNDEGKSPLDVALETDQYEAAWLMKAAMPLRQRVFRWLRQQLKRLAR